MVEFRFTLFNGITLFVLAFTVLLLVVRLRGRIYNSWPALFYLLALGYSAVFGGSLNQWWLVVGVAAALVMRFKLVSGGLLVAVRVIEMAALAYVVVRCVQLVILWPW